jgi:hypothetical protein
MSVDPARHDEETVQVRGDGSSRGRLTACGSKLLDDAVCDQNVDCQERTVRLSYLSVLEELLHGKPPLDEQADNFELLDVDQAEVRDLEF